MEMLIRFLYAWVFICTVGFSSLTVFFFTQIRWKDVKKFFKEVARTDNY